MAVVEPSSGAAIGVPPASTSSSARQQLSERLHSLLGAPLPGYRGLLSEKKPTFTLPGSARGAPATDPSYLRHLLHASPARRTALARYSSPLSVDAAARAGASPRKPIYEVLLEKGRAAQERRERLMQAAIEAETRDLRAAPSLPPYSAHCASPALIPAAAHKDPTVPGTRVEDRLLLKAREAAERKVKAVAASRARAEEELALAATFKPHISLPARRAKPKFRDPPKDFEEWRRTRREELRRAKWQKGVSMSSKTPFSVASAGDNWGGTSLLYSSTSVSSGEGEGEEVGDYMPEINARSRALAAQRRARLHSQPQGELRQQRLRAEYERQQQATSPGKPTITALAASLRHRHSHNGVGGGGRSTSVGERLHALAAEQEWRRQEREARYLADVVPGVPAITEVGFRTQSRYHQHPQRRRQYMYDDSMATDEQDSSSSSITYHSRDNGYADGEGAHYSHHPAINPVSAAIAEKLPESSRDRLYRQPARYQEQQRRERASEAWDARPVTTASPASALPATFEASLQTYEAHRQARLAELHLQSEQRSLSECTFAPALSSRGRTGGGGLPARSWSLRGPERVTIETRAETGRASSVASAGRTRIG